MKSLIRDGVERRYGEAPGIAYRRDIRAVNEAVASLPDGAEELADEIRSILRAWDGTHESYLRTQRAVAAAIALSDASAVSILVSVLVPSSGRVHDRRAQDTAAQSLGTLAGKLGVPVHAVLSREDVAPEAKLSIVRGLARGSPSADDAGALRALARAGDGTLAAYSASALLRSPSSDAGDALLAIALLDRLCRRHQARDWSEGEAVGSAMVVSEGLALGRGLESRESGYPGDLSPRAMQLLEVIRAERGASSEGGLKRLRELAQASPDAWCRLAAVNALARVGGRDEISLLEAIARDDQYSYFHVDGFHVYPVRIAAQLGVRTLRQQWQ